MPNRIPLTTWIRPSDIHLASIFGDCFVSPVDFIDVTVEENTFEDPRIETSMNCQRYPSSKTISLPFPLVDAADTNQEQTELGVETVKLAVQALCRVCPHSVIHRT